VASTIAKKITTIVYNPTGFREIPCHFPFSAFFDCTFANAALPAGFTRHCPFTFTIYQHKKVETSLQVWQIYGTIYFKETLNKARLTALYAICLQIFRHIAQKSLAIHQVCLRNF
jgi:hypothetical protein